MYVYVTYRFVFTNLCCLCARFGRLNVCTVIGYGRR